MSIPPTSPGRPRGSGPDHGGDDGLRVDLRHNLEAIAAAARAGGTGATGGAPAPAGAWMANHERISSHARRRRRRILLAVPVMTALLITGTTGAVQHWGPTNPTVRIAPAGTADAGAVTSSWRWSQLPEPPLSPRWHAVTAWTGTEALFLGGTTAPACPSDSPKYCSDRGEPSAASRDGVAYDVTTGRWRRTASAPQAVMDDPHVVIGQRVYVLTEDTLLVYDAEQDDWTQLPLPPGQPANSVPGYSLVTLDSKLVALAPGYAAAPGEVQPPRLPDSIYDLAAGSTGRWLPLPADPLDSMDFRVGLDTPYGLLLVASDVDRSVPTDAPPLVHAALLDSTSLTWRRLPDSDQVPGGHWTWTGERAVDATPGTDGGSDLSYGRLVPSSGAVTLPEGTWNRIPQPPEEGTGEHGWPVEATAGARVATSGLVYDDTKQVWTTVPAPREDLTADEPGPAVWTSRGLVVLGNRSVPTTSADPIAPTRSAWIYHSPH